MRQAYSLLLRPQGGVLQVRALMVALFNPASPATPLHVKYLLTIKPEESIGEASPFPPELSYPCANTCTCTWWVDFTNTFDPTAQQNGLMVRFDMNPPRAQSLSILAFPDTECARVELKSRPGYECPEMTRGGGSLEGEKKKVSTAGKEKWSSDRKLRNSSGVWS